MKPKIAQSPAGCAHEQRNLRGRMKYICHFYCQSLTRGRGAACRHFSFRAFATLTHAHAPSWKKAPRTSISVCSAKLMFSPEHMTNVWPHLVSQNICPTIDWPSIRHGAISDALRVPQKVCDRPSGISATNMMFRIWPPRLTATAYKEKESVPSTAIHKAKSSDIQLIRSCSRPVFPPAN